MGLYVALPCRILHLKELCVWFCSENLHLDNLQAGLAGVLHEGEKRLLFEYVIES